MKIWEGSKLGNLLEHIDCVISDVPMEQRDCDLVVSLGDIVAQHRVFGSPYSKRLAELDTIGCRERESLEIFAVDVAQDIASGAPNPQELAQLVVLANKKVND